MSRPQSQLHAQLEILKSTRKLVPEERRKEMFQELKGMEMKRRTGVAQREKEENDKETERLQREKERIKEERRRQREEEERRARKQKTLEKQKQEQLKKDRLRWEKVMMVEKQPIIMPGLTQSYLKKEQKAEVCQTHTVKDKASLKCLASVRKNQEHIKRKPLLNNWVGQQKPDSETVEEELYSNTPPLSADKASSKSKLSQSSQSKKRLQERLKAGLWLDKCHNQMMQRTKEPCRIKEQSTKSEAFADSSETDISDQFHCLTAQMSRNGILKKCIF